MAFKIAEGYVDVKVRYKRTDLLKSTDDAAERSAKRFTETFDRALSRQTQFSKNFAKRFETEGTRAGNRFAKAFSNNVNQGIKGLTPTFSRAGANVGRAYSDGAAKSVKRGEKGFLSGIRSWLGGSVNLTRGHLLILAGLFAAHAPYLGGLLGSGITLAFGGGIASLGIIAAAQSDKVRDAFSDMSDTIADDFKKMAKPLEDTLVDVSEDILDVHDKLQGPFRKAFKDMAPVLSEFSDHLADAFGDWGPTITAASDAFNSLLDALGPKLNKSLKELGDAFTELFNTIESDPDAFADIIDGLVGMVTALVRLTNWLSIAWIGFHDFITRMDNSASKSTAMDDLKKGAKDLLDSFTFTFGVLEARFAEFWDKTRPMREDIWDGLVDMKIPKDLSKMMTELGHVVEAGGALLGEVMGMVTNAISAAWRIFGDDLVEKWKGTWRSISTFIFGALDVIEGQLKAWLGVLTLDMDMFLEGMKIQGQGIVEILKSIGIAYETSTKFSFGVFTSWINLHVDLAVSAGIRMMRGFSVAAKATKAIVMDLAQQVVFWWNWLHIKGAEKVDQIVKGIKGQFDWLNLKLVGNSVVPDMCRAIVANFVVMRFNSSSEFDKLKTGLVNRVTTTKDTLVSRFNTLKTKALEKIKSMRLGMDDEMGKSHRSLKRQSNNLEKDVTGNFSQMSRKSINIWSLMEKGIGIVWQGVKASAANPMGWIISNVYNNGIKKMYDKIEKAIPALPSMPKWNFKGFATGGILPGYSPGRDNMFTQGPNGPVGLSGGEAIMRPEWTRAVGPAFVSGMNAVARSRGVQGVKKVMSSSTAMENASRSVSKSTFGGNPRVNEMSPLSQGFALGGVVDFMKKSSGKLIGNLKSSLKDPLGKMVGGLKNKWGAGLIPNTPYHLVNQVRKSMMKWAGNRDNEYFSGDSNWVATGDDLKRAVRWARSQHGKIYDWGGNGDPSWDCSGYLSAIESVIRGQNPHRRWSTHPFHGGAQNPLPGWRKNLDSPFRIGVTGAGVGHTAGTLLGNNVESSGSAGVRFNRGARGAGHPMFPHRYGFAPARRKARPLGDGSHDIGGMIPDKSTAYNRSGEPEMASTVKQLQSLVSAAEKGGDINVENLHLHIDKLNELDDILKLMDSIKQTARANSGRSRRS